MAKKKPPSQHGNGGQIIAFTHRHRCQLCRNSRTKRNSAAQHGTQKCSSKPYRPTPTLSRSFVVVSFQSTPVGLSVLAGMLPNPAVCLRVGVWDKTWDKSANYFETTSPQFHFCPEDKNGKALRSETARRGCQNGCFPSLAPV